MKTRNMSVRNFGLGSRNAGRALYTAYLEQGNAESTNAQVRDNLKIFANYMRDEHGLSDLRHYEKSHIESFAEHLLNRFENGDAEASRIKNMLSNVNVSLHNARRDDALRVEAKAAGFPSKSGIADHDRSIHRHTHDLAKSMVSERLSAQMDMQRELGLRFKESCLIDAKHVLATALARGVIEISDGTKGGRDREIHNLSERQLEVLQRAAEIQGNWRSMVPEHLSWSQYQSQCYREIRATDTGLKFHGERTHYANERYEKLMGCASPVRAGIEHSERFNFIAEQLGVTKQEARELDHAARLQISQELGHCRVSITNNYLG